MILVYIIAAILVLAIGIIIYTFLKSQSQSHREN